MHTFWTALLGVIAAIWLAEVIEIAIGFRDIPRLGEIPLAPDASCPKISVLFAARDESEKLPGALATLLSLDYPNYEVIGVDDRSEDGTGATLDASARKDSRLKAVHVASLPSGWLGKPHALQQAYENSGGEWLVFTDADVHFAPDVLRRAVALAEEKCWEHLTLMASVKMFTFGEKILMTFFGMAFVIGTRPWKTNIQESTGYTGVGAFQMIRRGAYEKMGTHRRLAMEVIDDMKLGKLVKEAGVHSGVALAGDYVSVHWHAGVRNTIRGTTKNFFAASGFRVWLTCAHVFGLLLMCGFPVLAIGFTHGWARIFALAAATLPLTVMAGAARECDVSPLYALGYPLGALIFAWMIARSAIVTLWQGGIIWRGTFYPLAELKRGVV